MITRKEGTGQPVEVTEVTRSSGSSPGTGACWATGLQGGSPGKDAGGPGNRQLPCAGGGAEGLQAGTSIPPAILTSFMGKGNRPPPPQ